MSLLHPTIGEKLDRLTILELKLDHAPGRQHFRGEFLELASGLPVWWDEMPEVGRLRAVNLQLWQANEQILREEDPPHFAREIYRLNLQRNQIIESINKAAGEYVGPEKV